MDRSDDVGVFWIRLSGWAVWWQDESFLAIWLWAAGAGAVLGLVWGVLLIPGVGVLPGLIVGIVFAPFFCLAFLGATFIACWVVGDLLVAVAKLKKPVGRHGYRQPRGGQD